MNASNAAVSREATLDSARLERLGAVVRTLYRDGRDGRPEAFAEWALAQLRTVVRFDSAMWGHGHADPVAIHDVVVVGQPPEMMANYARFQKDDFFAAACGARAGRTVNLYDLIDRAELVKLPIYRRHTSRFGIEHILCTVFPEPLSGLISFISLWRERYDDPYDEADRLAKQFLMPHLVEARRLSVLWHFRAAAHGADTAPTRAAICDPLGVLHEAETDFLVRVRTQWPQWVGPRLPEPLAREVARNAEGRFIGETVCVEWLPFEQRRLVTARLLRAADRLSSREREVAQLILDGLTYKAIAARLGVSPNTARTHVALLYKRLGVSNKAQMIAALDAAGSSVSVPARRSRARARSGPGRDA